MGSTIRMLLTADTPDQCQTVVADDEEHGIANFAGQMLTHIAHWDKSSLITESTVFGSGAVAPSPMFRLFSLNGPTG
jgi:hypothetical protein